jgi:hypothetical protein
VPGGTGKWYGVQGSLKLKLGTRLMYKAYCQVFRGAVVILRTPYVQAPEQLDFGYCPAKETTSKSFSFTNTGKLEVNYFWRLDSPFELTPPTGRIMPGETHSVSCPFSPVEGSVFVATVRVHASVLTPMQESPPPHAIPGGLKTGNKYTTTFTNNTAICTVPRLMS